MTLKQWCEKLLAKEGPDAEISGIGQMDYTILCDQENPSICRVWNYHVGILHPNSPTREQLAVKIVDLYITQLDPQTANELDPQINEYRCRFGGKR